MFNDLESVIQAAITRAAAELSKEIAQAARQSIATELLGAAGSAPEKKKRGRPPKAAATQAAEPAPAPKRKPGRPRKVVAEAAQATAAPKAPDTAVEAKAPTKSPEAKAKAPKPGKAKPPKPGKAKGKAGRGSRTYTDADLARAVEVIQAKPGLRPSQYQAQSGIAKKVWDNAIYKLKSEGKIKVQGKARNTSYVVA